MQRRGGSDVIAEDGETMTDAAWSLRTACPICGSPGFTPFFPAKAQPALSCALCTSKEEAQRCPEVAVALSACWRAATSSMHPTICNSSSAMRPGRKRCTSPASIGARPRRWSTATAYLPGGSLRSAAIIRASATVRASSLIAMGFRYALPQRGRRLEAPRGRENAGTIIVTRFRPISRVWPIARFRCRSAPPGKTALRPVVCAASLSSIRPNE